MEKKIKAVKFTTVIICVLLFVCAIVLAFQFVKIANLKQKSNNLETYRGELVEQINTYDATNAYYNNNRTEYLESYAREVLGWGLDSDTWYTGSNN